MAIRRLIRNVSLTIHLCTAVLVQAKSLVYHFDDEADVAAVNLHDNIALSFDRKAFGEGALVVDTLKTNSFAIPLPKNTSEGVVTFYVFDPLFAGESFFIPSITFSCEKEVNGTTERGEFALFMVLDDWQLHDDRELPNAVGDEHGRSLHHKRHGGWTRFDIVMPEGEGSKAFQIYIDGIHVGDTPDEYTSLRAAGVRAEWGGGMMYLDEFSFNSDPASLRPNVVQSIRVGENESRVLLTEGDSLKADLQLDRRGAGAPEGTIELSLLNGAEELVASETLELDWETLEGETVTVEFPTPSASGRYWIRAEYSDGGVRGTLPNLAELDVQFFVSDPAERQQRIVSGLWDFVPVGVRHHPRIQGEPPFPPAAPPQDWSEAIKLDGAWYDYGRRSREFGFLAGWYHREIEVPADWRGSDIFIDIEDVQTLATVYVNGQNVGEIEWPGGALDVSGALKPGEANDLSLYVRAEMNVGYNRVFGEILGEKFETKGNPLMRGLRGRVSLVSRPRGPVIDHSRIYTWMSDGPKQIEVRYRVSNLTPGQEYTLNGAVSAAGRPVLSLPDTSFVAETAEEEVVVKSEWNNPVLWDIGQPFLYDLNSRLSLSGQVLDVSDPVRFGFRDFAFKGNRVTLNGRPINLFQPTGMYFFNNPGTAEFMNRMHFNSFLGSHYSHAIVVGKGSSGIRDYVNGASEIGVGGGIPLGNAKFTRSLLAYGKENDPRFWNYFQEVVEYVTHRYGNNPGIFYWSGGAGGNILGMGAMYNPLLQDGLWLRDPTNNQQLERHMEVERVVQQIIRSADPSRPIVAQDSGNFNDASHITQYAGMTPVQELIEMNSHWKQHGTKPIFYSEHGAPFIANWYSHPRDRGHATKKIIPYFEEWCAIVNGDQAFRRAPLDEEFLQEYEADAKERFERIYQIEDKAKRERALQEYSNRGYPGSHYSLHDVEDNARNRYWLERIEEIFLNLRSDGIGQLCPWMGSLNAKDYTRWFAPVMAFLSGPPEDRYAKTHIYAPGEELRRGVTLLSNDKDVRPVLLEWALTLKGETVKSESAEIELAPGETLRVPVTAKIPEMSDGDGELNMQLTDARNGETIRSESIQIQILASSEFSTDASIALVDPEGDSAKALERAGIPFQLVPVNADLSPYDLIIFGRRSFLYELENTPEGFDLGGLTRARKKVLILEQDEGTLRNRFHLRTEYISPRIAYGREFRDGLLEGLPNEVLRFWRGSSTLTDGYAVARSQLTPRRGEGNGGRWFYEWNDGEEHTRPMKWGNHHNVATVVIIKPDTGAFRTLVDCEFGLNYAAAWQLDNAAGQVVFSQLDVSGRDESGPEVTRYLQNLVSYTLNQNEPDWKTAVYVGGESGGELLKSLFVPFDRIESPVEANPQSQVLVLGEVSTEQLGQWAPDLSAFVEAGGAVFSLPKNKEQLEAGWLPVPVDPQENLVNASYIGKSDAAILRGLGNSDFFWKGNVGIVSPGIEECEMVQFDTGVLTQIPEGEGSWVLCQIDPSLFGSEDYFWLKDSRRNTERMMRTLLLNLSVEMNEPVLLEKPKATREVLSRESLEGMWEFATAGGDTPQASPMDEVTGWKDLEIPGDFRSLLSMEDTERGAVWYRRSFILSEPIPQGAQVRLFLGAIQGVDYTFVNGRQVGMTNRVTNPNDLSTTNRSYLIPAELLVEGGNEIAILCDYNTNSPLSPGDGTITPPVYLEVSLDRGTEAVPEPINLDGSWQGVALAPGETEKPANNENGWHRIQLPGTYQRQHGDWGSHLGFFWVQREFVLPEVPPAGSTPMLLMGAVDDEDETFINGKRIGGINAETNPRNYWSAERRYRIPRELLKAGSNTIEVRINNTNHNGGIRAPIEILFEDPAVTKKRKLSSSPYLHQVGELDDPYMYQGW